MPLVDGQECPSYNTTAAMIVHPFSSLLAVHISDDFLSAPWLIGGFAIAAVLFVASILFDRCRARWRNEQMREEEIAAIGVLTSAFFVVSLIHIPLPLGPVKVHLLFNGLLGVVLRWRAAVAIPVGLFLQAVLFQHGGISSLGVNACVMTLPALLAWLLFAGLWRLPWKKHAWLRALMIALCWSVWALCLIYSLALIVSNHFFDLDEIVTAAANRWTFHPLTLSVVFLLGLLLAFFERKLDHAPEFPLGLFIGVVTVLATLALNSIALIYGGTDNWRAAALANVAAHMPVAALEGIILGFVVGFLARVKPSMLGIRADS